MSVRQTNYYIAQGRAVRCVVTLFDSIEDLVTENDRRYDADENAEATLEACRLRQGADNARGDDTSKLKEFKPNPPVDADDKNLHGFTNDVCGRLLLRSGIRDRSDGYIVTDLSFPVFLYERYTANPEDLEEGLFKGKILLQSYKAVFTSPSSAKDTEGDGDGADIIENNRRARRSPPVRLHILRASRQVRFTLSSVTSWHSFDGDFDYVQFWRTIVDFFERAPVDRLLEWWTRKVFGWSRHEDLTNAAKANMSVNALARQRAVCNDAAFDSP
ncbi:hypothetical protein EDB19DRAFT_1898377 [Suillus lakei]|nr:hypothetical protein EDB19DRAFT_1898377 [Suillus lakei]